MTRNLRGQYLAGDAAGRDPIPRRARTRRVPLLPSVGVAEIRTISTAQLVLPQFSIERTAFRSDPVIATEVRTFSRPGRPRTGPPRGPRAARAPPAMAGPVTPG